MMSVYVPMDVDVSIDEDIPINVSMDAHVSTVVIIAVIPTASRNYTVYGLNGLRPPGSTFPLLSPDEHKHRKPQWHGLWS